MSTVNFATGKKQAKFGKVGGFFADGVLDTTAPPVWSNINYRTFIINTLKGGLSRIRTQSKVRVQSKSLKLNPEGL